MSTPKPKKNTTATTITSSSRLTEVLTAPSLKVSPLMTAVLVFLTHTFFNAMLLSPWNSIRCTFWNQETCSSDVGWILNWFSFSHFHVALLLGCLSASSLGHAWMETKIAYLSSAVLLSFLSQGIFSLKYLNPPMAVFQAGIFGTLLVVINFWIQQDEINIPGSVYLATPFRSRSLSVSQRQKIAIPTLTLWIQLMLSIFRVVDMTFGDGKNGYMGDSSR